MLKYPQDAAVPTQRSSNPPQPVESRELKLPSALQGETMWYKPADDSDEDPATFEAAFARLTGTQASE